MRRWPLLALLLAPLLALWPGLTGLAIGPFDQIRAMTGESGEASRAAWDVLMADSVLQSHVWRTLVLDAWGKGQLPFWNPYQFAGTPLLANSQSGGFYPPHVLLGLLHVPAGIAGVLLTWAHLALAGVGVAALVRRMGGSMAGAVTGGLAFTLSPFLLGWAPLSSVPATVAWIPAALYFATGIGRHNRTFLILSLAMMFLAGHLQFAAYGAMAVVIVSLGQSATERRIAPGVTALIALAIGAGLAAPQLAPVLDYSKESHRRNSPTADGYRAYLGSAVRPFELANVAHPMALGSPRESVEVGGQMIAGYWPALVKPGANFAESAIGLDAVAFALLFAVPWKRRETWPLTALGLIALLLALGTPLNAVLYYGVPGWSSTGSPGRIEVLFLLAACSLIGLAVDRLTEKKTLIVAVAGAVVGLLFALLLPNLAEAEGPVVALRGMATSDVLMTGLLTTVLAIGALVGVRKSPWAVPVAVVAVAFLNHTVGLVPFGKPLAPIATAPNGRVAIINRGWDLYSVPNALMPPNLASLSGVHELSGYDSLTSKSIVDLLKSVNGGEDPAPASNGNMMFVKSSVDPAALAACGVTEVWSRMAIPKLGQPYENLPFLKYRLSGPGRVTGGSVEDGYDRQIVKSEPGKSVIIRDRFVPGWTSSDPKVQVQPIPDVGTWRAVMNPGPDNVQVTLLYRPPGFVTGCQAFLLALTALVALTILPRWNVNKEP